jgi:uncharacterized protein GlcG (DUF336 family)
MTELTLELADRIAEEVLAEGRRIGAAPLTVVVLDPGGHIVVAKRSDGSGILRIEIAHGKAYGALGMGLPGRALANRAAQFPMFFTALAAVSAGRMVPVPGGVLIRDPGGRLLGAVGISGDTSDKDEDCAVAAIRAVGLVPDTEVR